MERSVESGPATTVLVVVLYGWDDQQQVIGSCQQISCMEGPNLLLPFLIQDSFFNVLDSFRFTSLYRTMWFRIVFGNNGANERGSLRLCFRMLALCVGASPGSSEEEEECLPLRQFILV